jgi:hypothetical protein
MREPVKVGDALLKLVSNDFDRIVTMRVCAEDALPDNLAKAHVLRQLPCHINRLACFNPRPQYNTVMGRVATGNTVYKFRLSGSL